MPVLHGTPKSSMTRALDYDTDARTLTITYNTGARWRYTGVPEHIYQGMLEAPSVGRYINVMVKGVYAEERVDDDRPAAE